MYQYIVKRILLMIPTLFGAAILVFILMRLIPGDVCELRLAGSGATFNQSALDLCRHEIGVDQPAIVQFGRFVWGFATFDLGKSMWTGRPIVEEISLRFELSLMIAILATITATLFAIPLGTLAAIKQDILANISDSRLSVTAVANRQGFTPRYIHMLFEGEGVSFTEFVIDLRLSRAHRLLIDPRFLHQSISAIALRVGFGDLSYFNRTFRRRFGVTPSDVREQARHESG